MVPRPVCFPWPRCLASPKRKGRRRLSVALKDALGTASEGDTSSSCASHDGKGRSSAQVCTCVCSWRTRGTR